MIKRLFAIISLFLLSFAICGCEGTYLGEAPKYYSPNAFAYNINADAWKNNASELSSYQTQVAYEVYRNVTDYFGSKKDFPQILAVDELPGVSEGYECSAMYDPTDRTIYVSRGISDSAKDKYTLAHEYLHYLSQNPDNDLLCGFEYILGENWAFGLAFTEGATDYLANQVYQNPDTEEVAYAYEAHLAELFANAIGEDTFRYYFFTTKIEEIRETFNIFMTNIYPVEDGFLDSEQNLIFEELTPYDVFMGTVDTYQLLLPTALEDAGYAALATFMSYFDMFGEDFYGGNEFFNDEFSEDEFSEDEFDSEVEKEIVEDEDSSWDVNDPEESVLDDLDLLYGDDYYWDAYSDWDTLVSIVNYLEEEMVIFNHLNLRDVYDNIEAFMNNSSLGELFRENTTLEEYLPPTYEFLN